MACRSGCEAVCHPHPAAVSSQRLARCGSTAQRKQGSNSQRVQPEHDDSTEQRQVRESLGCTEDARWPSWQPAARLCLCICRPPDQAHHDLQYNDAPISRGGAARCRVVACTEQMDSRQLAT